MPMSDFDNLFLTALLSVIGLFVVTAGYIAYRMKTSVLSAALKVKEWIR